MTGTNRVTEPYAEDIVPTVPVRADIAAANSKFAITGRKHSNKCAARLIGWVNTLHCLGCGLYRIGEVAKIVAVNS
jgi:hypothetical protein